MLVNRDDRFYVLYSDPVLQTVLDFLHMWERNTHHKQCGYPIALFGEKSSIFILAKLYAKHY